MTGWTFIRPLLMERHTEGANGRFVHHYFVAEINSVDESDDAAYRWVDRVGTRTWSVDSDGNVVTAKPEVEVVKANDVLRHAQVIVEMAFAARDRWLRSFGLVQTWEPWPRKGTETP